MVAGERGRSSPRRGWRARCESVAAARDQSSGRPTQNAAALAIVELVLKRPRLIRNGNDRAYLFRALRHTYVNHLRTAAHQPATRQLLEDNSTPASESRADARELMEVIASAPAYYRDAVIAVDLLGLSYAEAARSLRTREATITSRLHRGRRHVARALIGETVCMRPCSLELS